MEAPFLICYPDFRKTNTAEIFTNTSFAALFVFFITQAMRKRREDNKDQ